MKKNRDIFDLQKIATWLNNRYQDREFLVCEHCYKIQEVPTATKFLLARKIKEEKSLAYRIIKKIRKFLFYFFRIR